MKFVSEFLDDEPLLPQSLYKLTSWAARYYFCSLGQMLSQALPVALRKGAAINTPSQRFYRVTASGKEVELDTLKRAPAQRKLLQQLQQQSLSAEEFNQLDFSKAALKALLDKHYIEINERLNQVDLSWRDKLQLDEEPHQLNAEQAIAVATLNQQQGYRTSLLEG